MTSYILESTIPVSYPQKFFIIVFLEI